jgi:ribosomal protein L37AE/L43A
MKNVYRCGACGLEVFEGHFCPGCREYTIHDQLDENRWMCRACRRVDSYGKTIKPATKKSAKKTTSPVERVRHGVL